MRMPPIHCGRCSLEDLHRKCWGVSVTLKDYASEQNAGRIGVEPYKTVKVTNININQIRIIEPENEDPIFSVKANLDEVCTAFDWLLKYEKRVHMMVE